MKSIMIKLLLLAALAISNTTPTQLVFTSHDKVYFLNDEDMTSEELNAPSGSGAWTYAVDYHSGTGDVYFSHVTSTSSVTRGIYKWDAESETSSLLLATGVVPGLAVDWIHNNLYYIDETVYTLNVMSLDSGVTKILHQGVATDIPRAVRVDPRDNQRFVYWTDWGDDAYIRRCGLDGEDCEILEDENIVWPNSITIEYVNNHLFWLEAYENVEIFRSNLDGSDRTLMTGLYGNPRGLDALDQTTIYATDLNTDRLVRLSCTLTACSVENVITGYNNPKDIQVMDPARQPPATNVCAGVSCPLCLPAVASSPSRDYTCFDAQGQEYPSVRIVGPLAAQGQGIVEIRRAEDEWTAMCDRGWGVPDCKVVCRELGLPFANAQRTRNNEADDPSIEVASLRARCGGDEEHFLSCDIRPVREAGRCTYQRLAGVICG